MLDFLQPELGIDLGTTYVLTFVPGKGVILNEPSVVAFSKDDNSILAVGNEAKEMYGKTPDSIKVYRPMKDGVIADYRVTEVMLRYFIRKTLGNRMFLKPLTVISVPAGVTSTERRAVEEAAIKAGAKEVHVVREPVLAAIGAGIPIQEARGHMIVDAGGGTTDVAVISLGGIVHCTSVKCAGNHIDKAIVDYLRRKENLYIGEKTAERIKIGIASAVNENGTTEMEVTGRDYVTGLPRNYTVKTSETTRAIQRELNEMVRAIKSVFQHTPPELAEDIMEDGIIMTGGTSQLKNLQKLIEERTGVPVRLADNSQLCVVKGAGSLLKYLGKHRNTALLKQ